MFIKFNLIRPLKSEIAFKLNMINIITNVKIPLANNIIFKWTNYFCKFIAD